MTLQFVMDSWDDAAHDAPEICRTAGALRILVRDQALTRNEELWSQTVKQSTRVSAYPLALWLAASWWRLRWEPFPTGRVSTSWRMAHEIAASGHGFLWPQMIFACDGENMQLWGISSRPDSKQPVRYLVDKHDTIPVSTFVESTDSFVELVLNRLDGVGIGATELHNLWNEVLSEREHVQSSQYRKIEAMLGFDPDDVDSGIVSQFVDLGGTIGSSVLGEVASVCSSENPAEQLNRVRDIADMPGIAGKFSLPHVEEHEQAYQNQPPWVRGQELARTVRVAMGANGSAISNSDLLSLAEISPRDFNETQPSDRLPLGIAVRTEGGAAKFVLRKRNIAGRRFELARLLCDHVTAELDDKWLPATDAKTIRQKRQRAFAAEFLCPIDSLIERLDDDFSEDAIEDAVSYFEVSERTVTSQLVNHGYLRELYLDDKVGGKFPYAIELR